MFHDEFQPFSLVIFEFWCAKIEIHRILPCAKLHSRQRFAYLHTHSKNKTILIVISMHHQMHRIRVPKTKQNASGAKIRNSQMKHMHTLFHFLCVGEQFRFLYMQSHAKKTKNLMQSKNVQRTMLIDVTFRLHFFIFTDLVIQHFSLSWYSFGIAPSLISPLAIKLWYATWNAEKKQQQQHIEWNRSLSVQCEWCKMGHAFLREFYF